MIPVAVPNLTGKEAEYTSQAIASGWVGPNGPFVERFEEMVAKVSGFKWAIATTSCTHALHAAFSVMGFAGKTIKVPKCSFKAARNVLKSLGCEIIYWDDDDEIWGIGHDWEDYHYGDWPVVNDCAPSIGIKPDKEISTVACFSFAANKTITTGQGGAIVGDDETLFENLRSFVENYSWMKCGASNSRMANINAAIGCAQLERLDEFCAAKKRIWQRYADAGLPMVDRGASRWMATIMMTEEKYKPFWNNGVIEYRHEFRAPWDEIEPAHLEEPNIYLSIPCSTNLTEKDQDKVIAACEKFLR